MDVSHCETCQTEFVAGVRQCADCGGALTAGPLPAAPSKSRADRRPALSPDLAAIDTILMDTPGEQAEYFAKALALEGITSRLECEGLVRFRGPNRAAEGALAATLPVSIYVAAADIERAREITDAYQGDDAIGDAWSEAAVEEGVVPESDAAETDDEEPEPTTAAPARPAGVDDEPKPEGHNLWLILFLVAAAIGVFVILRA